mgnify:FL=1
MEKKNTRKKHIHKTPTPADSLGGTETGVLGLVTSEQSTKSLPCFRRAKERRFQAGTERYGAPGRKTSTKKPL